MYHAYHFICDISMLYVLYCLFQTEFYLGEVTGKSQVKTAVQRIEYKTGSTNTAAALDDLKWVLCAYITQEPKINRIVYKSSPQIVCRGTGWSQVTLSPSNTACKDTGWSQVTLRSPKHSLQGHWMVSGNTKLSRHDMQGHWMVSGNTTLSKTQPAGTLDDLR